jgi:hypothetical protein
MNPTNNIAEQSIDRILGALRDATPPAGMESRLLRTLEMESRVPASASRSRFGFAWMAATCCATLAVAALVVGLKLHRSGPAMPAVAPAAVQHAAPQTQAATEPVIVSANAVNRPAAAAHLRNADVAHTTQSEPAEDVPPQYSAEISHPAPPIPMTEQEKLLLRYARRGHTDDLAQISNESRAAKEEQEKADFVAFFTPPPPPPTTGESE